MNENQNLPFRLNSKISDFDQALFVDIASALREQRKAIIPDGNAFGYTHGTRWHTKTTENKDENEFNEMQAHSTEIEVAFQDIIDNDIEGLARYRNTLVSSMMQEFKRVMYQTISDAASKGGNVVNAKGGEFKAEHFIEMIEKIEFGVDRDGNVIIPEIHVGSAEAGNKMISEIEAQGVDIKKRIDEITQRKSEAALERERERKSKFPKRGDD